MENENVNNIFFQSEEFGKIKKGTLRGIYIRSKKRFVKNKDMIEIKGETTCGETNFNCFKWKAYIEYNKNIDDTFIILVKEEGEN